LQSIGVGASLDQPGEPALVLFVSKRESSQSFPSSVDGVVTRVVEIQTKAQSQILSATESSALASANAALESRAALPDAEIARASNVQAQRVRQLLKINGVQGVGIGASSDHVGEAALVIFTVRGVPHDTIPGVLDGVRTKIRESSPFRLGNSSRISRSQGCTVTRSSAVH
jgi:hypothetical protein